MKYIPTLFTHLLFLAVYNVFALEGPDPLSDGDVSLTRLKRQASPLSRAWEEALPGVQPFWEKYNSGPHGIVIRGWQFSRCASEQVRSGVSVKIPEN